MGQLRFPATEEEKTRFMKKHIDPAIAGATRMRVIYGRSPSKCGDCKHYSPDGPTPSCGEYDGPATGRGWGAGWVGCGLFDRRPR